MSRERGVETRVKKDAKWSEACFRFESGLRGRESSKGGGWDGIGRRATMPLLVDLISSWWFFFL